MLPVNALKICLPHRSVTSFLRGAPPPKKNPGSALAITILMTTGTATGKISQGIYV